MQGCRADPIPTGEVTGMKGPFTLHSFPRSLRNPVLPVPVVQSLRSPAVSPLHSRSDRHTAALLDSGHLSSGHSDSYLSIACHLNRDPSRDLDGVFRAGSLCLPPGGRTTPPGGCSAPYTGYVGVPAGKASLPTSERSQIIHEYGRVPRRICTFQSNHSRPA